MSIYSWAELLFAAFCYILRKKLMHKQISRMGMSNGNKNGNNIIEISTPTVANMPTTTAPIIGKINAHIANTAKITIAQMPNAQPAAVAAMVMPSNGMSKKCHASSNTISKIKNEMIVFDVLLCG